MRKSELSFFGKALINDVRDSVYREYLLTKGGGFKTKEAENIRFLIKKIKEEGVLDRVILSTIDLVIFKILFMLEENNSILKGDWGEFNARKDSDGLCGEIYGEDGWIEQFSSYPPSEE